MSTIVAGYAIGVLIMTAWLRRDAIYESTHYFAVAAALAAVTYLAP